MNPLPAPARYSPFRNGKYEVSPRLQALGTSFGNGAADARLLQLDTEFPAYRENKLACRRECPEKYFRTQEYDPDVSALVARTLLEELARDYPALFQVRPQGKEGVDVACSLTGETLRFGPGMTRVDAVGPEPISPGYADALDALACQVQEDLAVVSTQEGRDWLSAVHVCSPSGWAPAEKIGQDFAALHDPVPGMEALRPLAGKLVDLIVHRGPHVRFVWGISPDRRLNRHPEPPAEISPEAWRGSYDWSNPSPFVVRVERQCLYPLPQVGASLFCIRLSFIEAAELREDAERRALLREALLTMSPASRAYKGITECFEPLIAWLGG